MRLITSGNEILSYLGEGWLAFTPPDNTNLVGLNSADGLGLPYYFSNIDQPSGRQTPSGNGGFGYFFLPRNQQIMRPFVDPTAPEAGNVTYTELYGRFACNFFNSGSNQRTVMAILDSSGNRMFTIQQQDNGGNTSSFNVWQGDPYNGGSSIHSFTSDAISSLSGAWQAVEWHIKTDPTNGLVEMRYQGRSIYTFAGQVQGPTTQTQMAYIVFEQRTVNNGTSTGIDDIVVNETSGTTNNSWPGLGYVTMFFVGRDGTLIGGGNQLTNERSTHVDNWGSVETINGLGASPNPGFAAESGVGVAEIRGWGSPGVVSFSGPVYAQDQLNWGETGSGLWDFTKQGVAPTASGQKDSYRLPGVVQPEYSGVSALQILTLCQGKDTIRHLNHLLEFAGPVEVVGPTRTLPKDMAWLTTLFDKNPNSGVAWTLSDLNAIEFGQKFTT